MRECATCKYANRSGNDDFAFCIYWQNRANNTSMESEEFVLNMLLDKEPTLNGCVGIGWAYPKQSYTRETNWHEKGTASADMMWNNQICVQANAGCSKYEKRE